METEQSTADLAVDPRIRVLLDLVTVICRNAVQDDRLALTCGAGQRLASQQLFEAVFTTGLFNSISRLVNGFGFGQSVAQSRTSTLSDRRWLRRSDVAVPITG